MFKEILQIVPKISNSDLNQMTNTLSSRFAGVAKKFGKGLAGAITGGGIIGAATALVGMLMNPLKETQEAIDRTLKHADDVVTNAKLFGTTPGKLARLQALAGSTDLGPQDLNVLLTKFQGAVAEAAADPEKHSAVRNFVGEKDTATAFFEFIQGLQKLDSTQQTLVQQEVFGEKQILKIADFLQTDFEKLQKTLGGPTAQQLEGPLNKEADLNDLSATLAERRKLQDIMNKGKVINEGMIRSHDNQETMALAQENRQIAGYDNLAKISEAAKLIEGKVSEGITKITGLLLKVTDLTENVRKLTESRAAKGIMKFIGGGD